MSWYYNNNKIYLFILATKLIFFFFLKKGKFYFICFCFSYPKSEKFFSSSLGGSADLVSPRIGKQIG